MSNHGRDRILGKAKKLGSLKEVYKIIRREGTRTGSRVWGVHSEDSDYDYIIPNYEYNVLMETLDKNVITFHDQMEGPDYEGNPTFYFEYRSRLINVISPCLPQDLKAWIWATEAMKLIDKDYIKNKQRRVPLFQKMRAFYIEFIFDDVPF